MLSLLRVLWYAMTRENNCKVGMMEEWHQKLHNNTSPYDVIICQAPMDYIKSDMDISVYWNTLNTNGITKERLLSYDRTIHNEPKFSREQKEGLLRDLGHYMRTLKAVHSGADLESAISNCMGYISENDSPATLLARVIGIVCPIDQDMLAKGLDTHKYFTKTTCFMSATRY